MSTTDRFGVPYSETHRLSSSTRGCLGLVACVLLPLLALVAGIARYA